MLTCESAEWRNKRLVMFITLYDDYQYILKKAFQLTLWLGKYSALFHGDENIIV